jgi:hypothetical protein
MLLVLLGWIVWVRGADGQPPAGEEKKSGKSAPWAKKSALESALEEAAKHNPDLRVALAKLAEAEAEVARTRLRVIQKVVSTYQTVEKARKDLNEAEETLSKHRSDFTTPKLRSLQDHVAVCKKLLADAEAEMAYLLGKPLAKNDFFTRQVIVDYRHDPDTVVNIDAERTQRMDFFARLKYVKTAEALSGGLRQALARKSTFTFTDKSAREVLAELKKQSPGLHIQAVTRGTGWDEKVTATLADVPFSAALQLLEDVLAGHRIVVREYGLFIVPQDKVPPGAVMLSDFLQAASRTEQEKGKK